jgi:transposase
MPSSHRRYRDWTHERIRHEAANIGSNTSTLIDLILSSKPHPEQGFRSCIGIIRLVKQCGSHRVEAACGRALSLNTRSYTSVATILKNNAEKLASSAPDTPVLTHSNIRGPEYYH